MFYSRSSRQSTSCHSGVISLILVAKEDNVYFIVGLCSGTGTRSLDGNLLHSFERSWELKSLIVRLKLCGTCWWDSGRMVQRPPTGPHRRPVTCSTWCACRCCMCLEDIGMTVITGQWMTEDETMLEHPFLHSLMAGRRGEGWRHWRSTWSFVQCPASGDSHLNHMRLLLILCFKHSASLSLPHYERIVMEWIWEEFRD